MAGKKFIAGNWKMHKTASEAAILATALKDQTADLTDRITVAVCPPFTALERVSTILSGSGIAVGAQNLSEHKSGA